MLKKAYANTQYVNSSIPIKPAVNGIINIALNHLPDLQSNIHSKNALLLRYCVSRLTQCKRNLTCCSHNCNCSKCLGTLEAFPVKKENNVVNKTNSILCEAENVPLDGNKKLLVANQFQNNILARNYSGSKPKCDSKDSKKGDGKKKDNLTAVLHAIDDLRMEQRPIPKISDKDVLIAMDSVGICGSDVHYWVKGRIGDFVLKKPMVIGHEGSGIIEKVGKKVKHLKKGDRVAIEPGYPCRYCNFCKQGKYHLCPGMIFCATPPYDGNLTRYYKHPADFCFKIPSFMTMEEAVLLEPLAVGVHACTRAKVTLGSEALIFGSGPVGLTTLTVAKAMGATKVTILDVKEDRLKVAKKMGADYTLLVKPDEPPKSIVKKIIKKNRGRMPDKTFDCVGTEQAVKTGIFATRSGGVIVLIGMGEDEAKLPIANALAREVDIRGVFRYCNDYEPALALVASKKVPAIKHMITHHFDIKETEKAFTTVRCNEGGAIKVIIHVQPKGKNNPKKGKGKGKGKGDKKKGDKKKGDKKKGKKC